MTKKRGLGSGFGGLIASVAPAAGELHQVPIASIVPNPHQPRLAFDQTALEELAASIREHGLLQPLVVTRSGDDQYQLIAGERRLRAARLAGLPSVPVVVKEASEQQQLELALIENVQRADLDPIEEARAYAVLQDQFNLTHDRIAERVGKSRSSISETLGLLKLPSAVQEMVSAGQLTIGHASRLVSLRDDTQAVSAARAIVEQGMSVRRAEQFVGDLRKNGGKKLAFAQTSRVEHATPEDDAVVSSIEEQLGMRVQLQRSSTGGRLVIHFDNEEMLSALYDRLVG